MRERRAPAAEAEAPAQRRRESVQPPAEQVPEPSGNRLVERVRTRREGSRPQPVADHPSEGVGEPAPAQEPIDRLSAFESIGKATDEVPETQVPFGRHRRPFTPRRKARQVKPPETKTHLPLGGDSEGEPAAERTPEEPAMPRPAVSGRIGMPDGIGPVDFEGTEEVEEE
jgi:hypothetical protein